MHHHRPYRTAAQHAADVLAWRRLILAEAHVADCQCWACCAAGDDFTPDMGDPHEPFLDPDRAEGSHR